MHDTKPPIWNPFKKGYMENPYEQFRILREQNPIHKGINGRWMLFKYNDVKFFLNSPKLRTLKVHEIISAKNRYLEEGENLNHLSTVSAKWLLFLDPPEHTELRSTMIKIWHSYDIQEYIKGVVEETLKEFAKKKEIDIVRDFAMFIPSRIICKMLGLPAKEYKRLRDWAYHFIRVLEPFENIHELRAYNQKAKKFYIYLQNIIEEKTRNPDDAFISKFLSANQKFETPLGEKEIISSLCVLFFAGIETSVNLFSQSILLLINNPENLSIVQENEILSGNATNELIRYITPTQYTKRVALEDIEIKGKHIKAGEMLMGSMASANRDEEIFEQAEKFNLKRDKNPHLGFGFGMHFCVGARLAREELSISLPALFRSFPNIALHPKMNCEWDDLVINRTLKSLPVILNC